MTEKEEKKECNFCGGTGQASFFMGVSRFLLSVEECPECAGLGYVLEDRSAKGGGKAKKKVRK